MTLNIMKVVINMKFKIITKSVAETMEIAQKIISKKFPNMVICLDGELGAGKTTFTKGIADALKISEVITSPTFTIIKEYSDGEMPLYHIDVYRLEGNVEGLGLEEYFTRNGIVVIEWSDTIKDVLPKERLDIKIMAKDKDERVLVFEPHGKEYEELCGMVL